MYIGSEYSTSTKDIWIKITDTAIIYDSIVLDNKFINKNKVTAFIKYNEDSSFRIQLTLTYNENYIWGYEYLENSEYVDSIYVFGEKL